MAAESFWWHEARLSWPTKTASQPGNSSATRLAVECFKALSAALSVFLFFPAIVPQDVPSPPERIRLADGRVNPSYRQQQFDPARIPAPAAVNSSHGPVAVDRCERTPPVH